MNRIIKKANYDLADTEVFIKKVSTIPFDFFERGKEIFVSRAPGRLDVIGGIADYSGSLVLETPVKEATFAALQKRSDRILKICSEDENENLFFEMPLEIFDGELNSYSSVRKFFNPESKNHWASYIAGVFAVLMREKNVSFETGANIFISSGIPQGKGVSAYESYSACGLETAETDLLVELVGKNSAFYGAKIIGGSGGTVAILGRKNSGGAEAIREIAFEYEN